MACTIAALPLVSCARDDGNDGANEAGEDGTMEEIVDDLPTVPPLPEGAREYAFPEQIIPPGTEVQTCWFLDPEQADVYADALESYQGQYGHHMVLFYTAAPEPPGTVRDCTSIADMLTLLPAISSVNFGLEKFPEGMAIRLPAGTQLVVQQHYVNTSDKPIRVRDVMHLHLEAKEEVQTLAGFYGVSDVEFVLPPDPASEQEVTFECTVPRDMNLLMMGPHMHEWGVRFTAEVERPGEAPEEVVHVEPWMAEFRDNPPVHEFGETSPLRLAAGDILRTKCVFKNTSGAPLEFPSEMCATYGYYFPAPEGSEAWTCGGDE
jgi:hypothetical protein